MSLSSKMLLAVFVMVIISLALACSGLCAGEAHAASKYKQHKKYEKTINSYNAKMKKQAKKFSEDYGNSYDNYCTYFAYADIDRNGVDELIVRYTYKNERKLTTIDSYGYGETTSVYTIRKGKVRRVINHTKFEPYLHSAYVKIYKGSKYIDRGFSHGYEDLAFYKFNKGRLSKNPVYLMSSYETSYQVNNNAVSAKRYKALKKSLMKKGKGYRMHVYTAKNLKRYR